MHRFVPHTGELELELEAEQPAGVFVDAALALADLIGDERGDPLSLRVRVEAADRASLLVEWLNELVFLAEKEGLVAEELGELELRERTVEATITGRRAETRQLVKAVTYHDLVFERRGDGWFARIVLDV